MTPFEELVTERRVHRSVYTDEAIFALEMEKVFGATWTYVAHESEIAGADDFVQRHLGRRPVIVTRDGDGEVHVLLNRCTHRAATVCRVEQGTARRFTCPYHGWTFANNGDCVAVPLPGAYGPGWDKTAHGLGRPAPRATVGFRVRHPQCRRTGTAGAPGSGGGPPRRVDRPGPRRPGWSRPANGLPHRLVYHGNWKLAVDNSGDGYHPGYSHKSLLAMRKERYGPGVDMQYVLNNVDAGRQYVQDLGRGHHFLDQRDELSPTGRRPPRARAGRRTRRC